MLALRAKIILSPPNIFVRNSTPRVHSPRVERMQKKSARAVLWARHEWRRAVGNTDLFQWNRTTMTEISQSGLTTDILLRNAVIDLRSHGIFVDVNTTVARSRPTPISHPRTCSNASTRGRSTWKKNGFAKRDINKRKRIDWICLSQAYTSV